MADRAKHERRVFLVVVVQTPELSLALRFACRRARATGGRVAMLYVTEPAGGSEWLAVGDLIREERRAEAEARLQELSAQVVKLSGDMPIFHLREGSPKDELLKLLDEEPNISILVLGAGTGPKGPGPLVSALAGLSGRLRVPITIVPGGLSEADVDAIT